MEALKKLLGDNYKEGITLEDVNAALSSIKLVDPDKEKLVPKSILDKNLSELADWKKKYNAKLTEEEAKEQAQKELMDKLAEYETREKRLKIEKDLSKLGIKDEQVATLTDSFLSGDTTNFASTLAALKKEIAESAAAAKTKELLKTNNPEPPAGSGGGAITKETFAKMGYEERLKLYEENKGLYDQLSN